MVEFQARSQWIFKIKSKFNLTINKLKWNEATRFPTTNGRGVEPINEKFICRSGCGLGQKQLHANI